MTILLCGSSGLLGREMACLFDKKNIEYIGTYNTNVTPKSVKIDFTNYKIVEDFMSEKKITICINSIVERQLDICENEWNKTKETNIDITNIIAKVCKKLNIFFIHISTDYVFDGSSPPYYPDSLVNPLQNYGISKLISEYKVINNCNNYCIIRVPVLFTDKISNLEENAVTLIGKKVLNRIEKQKEDNFSIRRPNYIPDFCEFILDIVKKKRVGIYHYSNPNNKITKYEISVKISNLLHKNNNISPINIAPEDGVERPKDTHLLDDKYNIQDYVFTNLNVALERCFSKMYHPKLEIQNIIDRNAKDLFMLLDLDGTIIDSDKIHYMAYCSVFEEYGKTITYEMFLENINNGTLDTYINNTLACDLLCVKTLKNKYIETNVSKIEFIKNFEILLNYITKNSVNCVVVTNTSMKSVSLFKEILPELNKLENWVTREDYKQPKPNKECYETAIKLFYKEEKYIIGFENTISGYKSLKNVTNCIYTIPDSFNYEYFKHQDVYIINDYNSVFY